MYKQVTEADIRALIDMTDKERVLPRETLSEDYSHDELGSVRRMPEVLVRVQSTEEISAVMAYAHGQNIPVVVRGSGTGLVGEIGRAHV